MARGIFDLYRGMQDPQLWHAEFFLVMAFELLVLACGIPFSDQG